MNHPAYTSEVVKLNRMYWQMSIPRSTNSDGNQGAKVVIFSIFRMRINLCTDT
jgi:hypothetical protein